MGESGMKTFKIRARKIYDMGHASHYEWIAFDNLIDIECQKEFKTKALAESHAQEWFEENMPSVKVEFE